MWSTWPALYLEYLEYLEWATQLFTKTLRSLSSPLLSSRELDWRPGQAGWLEPNWAIPVWKFRHLNLGRGQEELLLRAPHSEHHHIRAGTMDGLLVSPRTVFCGEFNIFVVLVPGYCFLLSWRGAGTSASYWGKQRSDGREYKPTTYRLEERHLPGITSGYSREGTRPVMKQK